MLADHEPDSEGGSVSGGSSLRCRARQAAEVLGAPEQADAYKMLEKFIAPKVSEYKDASDGYAFVFEPPRRTRLTRATLWPDGRVGLHFNTEEDPRLVVRLLRYRP